MASSKSQALDRFWKAVFDPDPSSTEVAVDIALENGFKLWQLGEIAAEGNMDLENTIFDRYVSVGEFFFSADAIAERPSRGLRSYSSVEWRVQKVLLRDGAWYKVHWFFTYQDKLWEEEDTDEYQTLEEARTVAVDEAWHMLSVMKRGVAGGHDRAWVFDEATRTFGWKAGGAPSSFPRELNPARNLMTDKQAKAALLAAIEDPDPSSIEIAQDIALERHWKLWQMGRWVLESRGEHRNKPSGEFVFLADGNYHGVTWDVRELSRSRFAADVLMTYKGREWKVTGSWYATVAHARLRAAEMAWGAFATMKQAASEHADPKRVHALLSSPEGLSKSPTPPLELVYEDDQLRKNPSDDGELERARAKYKEFHRLDPKKVGEFPSSFKIPTRLLHAGKAKWVTYRSGKVDPSTLEKPKGTIDYIHEHDAGVETYIKDPEPDTDVPAKFTDVGALVLLGKCLGFCIVGSDGEEVEAEATAPLPELYCSSDGKCLYVIQDKKDVLAMSWGGALGVFARGIDG